LEEDYAGSEKPLPARNRGGLFGAGYWKTPLKEKGRKVMGIRRVADFT